MAIFTNASHGAIVMPDGKEVAHGDKVQITKNDLDHPAVAHWIETGWLERVKIVEADKK